MAHHADTAKNIGDALSLATVVGTLADALPAIAALISIVWGLIRIYETATVQKLLGRHKNDAPAHSE